jgi:hypothetical protein
MTALDWFLVVFGWVVVIFLILGGVHIGQTGRRRRP